MDLAFPSIQASALATLASIRVWRGDNLVAQQAIDRARDLSANAAVPQITAAIAWAAGRIALADHDFPGSWVALQKVRAHPVFAQWAIGDLAEAAVRCGTVAEFRPLLQRVESETSAFGSAEMTMLIERSKAVTGIGSATQVHFDNAIRAGEQAVSRLEMARTRMMYGTWLRTHRRPVEARRHLTAAYTAFEAERATPLGARAARELRAAGAEVPRSRLPTAQATASLTPQERQVAQLAATGLTNKEIADRIYLSHRTVGTHLSNAYAKLGIKSRAQLDNSLRRLGAD